MTVSDDVTDRPVDLRLLVLYDGDCGVCALTARVLQRLDRRGNLRLLPLQAADGVLEAPALETLLAAMRVRDPHGRWSSGGAAAVRIAEAIPLLWPIAIAARVPLVQRGIDRAYGLVAANRRRISRALGMTACPVRPVD